MSSFQCASFQDASFQTNCTTPTVDDHHAGLLLDPPPGWQAISPNRPTPRYNGPINRRNVLTSIDFNRDDPDELWLLGLTDLETN